MAWIVSGTPYRKGTGEAILSAMNGTIELCASCAVGLERILDGELGRLGAVVTKRGAGRVWFSGDDGLIARILVNSRIADRLFIVAGSFVAGDFDRLFEGVRAIPWERWVGKEDRLVVEKARSLRSKLAAQNAIQSISQKAAYERLCSHYRQSSMPETAGERKVRIRIEDDRAEVELDLCGSPLSKRGYRRNATEAPLKETIAAGLLFLSGWKRSYPLYDPFCGGGTIAIEAALYALDFAPGLSRSFDWEGMPSGSSALVKEEKERARGRASPARDLMIGGSDADEAAVRAAVANARLAGLADRVRFFKARAEDASPPAERGYVITDPPYGKRLGSPEEASALYDSLGPFAKRFKAWELCWVVDREDFKLPGLGKAKRNKIVDGAELRWFHRFIAGGSA